MHSLAVQMLRMCSHAFLGCIDAFIGCAEVFEKGERLHAFIRCADVSLTRLCLEGVHAHVVMVAGVHWAPCMVALCCCVRCSHGRRCALGSLRGCTFGLFCLGVAARFFSKCDQNVLIFSKCAQKLVLSTF